MRSGVIELLQQSSVRGSGSASSRPRMGFLSTTRSARHVLTELVNRRCLTNAATRGREKTVPFRHPDHLEPTTTRSRAVPRT